MFLTDELSAIIANVFLEVPNHRATNTHVQKLLFELKMQLGNEPYVQQILPYYWYEIGPFSEVVAASTSEMVQDGLLSKQPKVLVLNTDLVPPLDLQKPVAEKIKQIARQFRFYKFNSYLKEMYYSYAPYDFIPMFKYEFLDALKKYVFAARKNQTVPVKRLDTPLPTVLKTLEDTLECCAANLPSDDLFDEFKELFTSFAVDAITVFSDTRHNEPNLEIYQAIEKEAKGVWKCFASGVRILPNGHDSFYDHKVIQWSEEFRNKADDLAKNLNELTFKIVDALKSDEHYPPEDEQERHLIEGFLSWPSS
jgi:hypothetical protein